MAVTLRQEALYLKDANTGEYKNPAILFSDIGETEASVIANINERATAVQASLPEAGEMEEMLASPFISGHYDKGSCVIQAVNGVTKLYEFTADHDGAWTGTDVREIKLANRVTSIEAEFNNDRYYIGENTAAISRLNGDVTDLKSAIDGMEGPATSADEGKALIVKTVSNNKVTEWEYSEAITLDDTLTQAGEAADAKAVGDAISAVGTGLSDTIKNALLACFRHVVWIDEHGSDYYNTLYDALFSTPISISASFTQGSAVIYNTDTLDSLRQYLTVIAVFGDETSREVTTYILLGTLMPGTSEITVSYGGKTDSFTVNVTESLSYITAVYTPGSNIIYTDTPLNDLKTNLVVTYYSSPSSEGIVIQDSDYSLSGTLIEGTNTIQVLYNGMSTSFNLSGVVDFYNIQSWGYPNDRLLKRTGSAAMYDKPSGAVPAIHSNNTRRCFYVNHGKLPFVDGSTGADMPGVYPIPCPDGATSITGSITPSSQYFNIRPFLYSETAGYIPEGRETGWQLGTGTFSGLNKNKKYFFLINCKGTSSGSSYPTEPTGFSVSFGFD